MARRRRKIKFKLKKQSTYNIFVLLLIGIALLLSVSFFQSGSRLDLLKDIVLNQLGWGGYFLPIVLTLFAFLFLKIKTPLSKANIPFGALLSYLCIISLTQAGYIGRQIWINFTDSVSEMGAFIILFGMFCIGLIVLFNTSIEDLVKFFSSLYKNFSKAFAPLFTRKSKPAFIEKLPIRPPDDYQQSRKEVAKDQPKGMKGELVPKPAVLPNQAILNTGVLVNIPAADKVWEYPPLSLLDPSPGKKADRGDIKTNAQIIESTLDSFGITAKVVDVNRGPAVTQYCLDIAQGIKVSKITALSSDMALALAATTGHIRIEAPIPGKRLVGIEVPNRSLEFVTLHHMLSSDLFNNNNDKLTVALGLDVAGQHVLANIAKMPHVLIAGTTGSGKSVLINSWICSLLFRTSPLEVKIIMVDPKRVELIGYNGIPHLLTPVIVEPDQILSALKWATQEMDKRYKLFAEVGVRNIAGYNEISGFQAVPHIVIFIDELADLMAYAPVEVEGSICRIAQMARATGIHLVIATQRPSVDVITGLIKANIPSRIAFSVSSMIDSRVIIDTPGAEKLLGRGDMLYIPPDQAKPTRIQGTFVSDNEVKKVVAFLKSHNTPVEYTKEVTSLPATWKKSTGGTTTETDGKDSLFEEAVRVVCQYDRASASLLQRRLSIGYARAARIIDQLESEGIIGAGEGAKPRDVLIHDPANYLNNKEAESSQQTDISSAV